MGNSCLKTTMAASSPSTGNCEHVSVASNEGSHESLNQIFRLRETLDHPFDITLVVQNGKELKAHSHVLSEASPYFEKLLNSGMRESKEGVVRLETISEATMEGILEFIYTGTVHMSTQEITTDLFMMADYFLLPNLKSLAGSVLLSSKTLSVSNCVSTYYFAQKYRLKELACKAESFILENFIIAASTEEFLNLSSKDVEMWISKDEIHVGAEEDVFKIILTWIDHNKSERKKYFAELFRQVRLVYVSRDSLRSDIVMNDLVKHNEGCLDLVNKVMSSIHSKNYDHPSVKPRKSLETPLIVVCAEVYILCYFPRENRWCEFAENLFSNLSDCELASCCGKLYFLKPNSSSIIHSTLHRYDSFSNTWKLVPYEEDRYLRQIFVRNDDEMFALVTEKCLECDNLSCLCCRGLSGEPPFSRRKKLNSVLTRYKPESNSWEEITSFDFGLREGMCIVTKDSFIYFIGGGVIVQRLDKSLRIAERYDLQTNRWDKVADIQEERMFACGAASRGRIFVAGGMRDHGGLVSNTCEVYSEATNEWHFVASLISRPGVLSSMVCIDDKLYVVGGYEDDYRKERKLQCYDPEKNKWSDEVEIPMSLERARGLYKCYFNACSMRVFTGFLDNLDIASTQCYGGLRDKRKCSIM